MQGVQKAVSPKELAEMLGISAKTAHEHIKRHPRRIEIGLGNVRKRYRLPYEDAVMILTGQERLPKKNAPKARRETKKEPPRLAANGCRYAQKRK